MTSLQQPGAKPSKFVGTNNLLDPMMRPFQGLKDNDTSAEAANAELQHNVNQRMGNAMKELQTRHQQGTQFVDDPDRAPTGPAYARNTHPSLTNASNNSNKHATTPHPHNRAMTTPSNDDDDNDSDDAWLDDDEDDPYLESLRQQRLQELKREHEKKAQEMALGHGEVRTISQDEFLPECTGSSEYVAVHFYHREFARCHIMDHHFQTVAPLHTSCKFLRLNAEKAPFFVAKLQLKTLPTVIVFRNGKAVARLVGFEGLESRTNDPDEWETSSLQRWLAQTGAIHYQPSPGNEEDDDGTRGRSNRVIHRGLVSSVTSSVRRER